MDLQENISVFADIRMNVNWKGLTITINCYWKFDPVDHSIPLIRVNNYANNSAIYIKEYVFQSVNQQNLLCLINDCNVPMRLW